MDVCPRSSEISGTLAVAMEQVLEPIETARGLPNACYTDAATIEIEQQRVFKDGWACVGFALDVPDRGDLFPIEFSGSQLLLTRNADDVVQVFHNVCRHRGRILVEASINSGKVIICPYHSWTYDLEGQLIGTPHIGGAGKHTCPGFNKNDIGLCKVRSAEWFGLIFVDLSGTAQPFADYIKPLAERWKVFAEVDLVDTGADCRIEIELDCNWKLAVENYCEAYHLPWVHPELNRYSPLEQHYGIVHQSYSGQGSRCYEPKFSGDAPAIPNAANLPPFWHSGAEYVALFPNVLLGLHRDHFYAVLIQPDGPCRTRERMQIYYFDRRVRDHGYHPQRIANRELWQSIFVEDRAAVESMQRGRHSIGFDGGIFSPVMDQPTHAFHSWIARAFLYGRSNSPVVASP